MKLLISVFAIGLFALIEVNGGKHHKGGFGKALGGAGKTFHHVSRDVGRTINHASIGRASNHAARNLGRAANHAGGAINTFGHKTAHQAERTTNQAIKYAGRTTNQAVHKTERAANQAGRQIEHNALQATNFVELRANQAGHQIERTVELATPYVQRAAYKTGNEIRHAAYANGDGIKDAANAVGNHFEADHRHDRDHRRDHLYCHHCRCYRSGCRCHDSYYWYGFNSHQRRYQNNYYYFWSSLFSKSQSHSSTSYSYSSDLSSAPYAPLSMFLNRDDEFNELYSHTRNEKIACAKPTCNERYFGIGKWISGNNLIQKIIDSENVHEIEYIDMWFYFESKYELLIAIRECLINHRAITLKKLSVIFNAFILDISSALMAWFFHELYLPFDESARRMASKLLSMAQDVNEPYNGKTSLRYALENFNFDAFEWIYEQGGRLGKYNHGDIVHVRSEVVIESEDLLKYNQVFDKCNVNQVIIYHEGRRQFELSHAL